LVQWPTGKILGAEFFIGSPPPLVREATESACGSDPTVDFLKWLFAALDDKSVFIHGQRVYSVAFSPDGRILAAADNSVQVNLWDLTTGQLVHTDTWWGGEINDLSFSPDRKILATGSQDGAMELWDLSTIQERRTLADPRSTVRAVAFSPDGKLLAAIVVRDVKVWDIATGQEVYTFGGFMWNTMAFSPDSKTLALGNMDGTVTLWDVTTGQKIRTLPGQGYVNGTNAFSPDGKTLLRAEGNADTMRLVDVETGQVVQTFPRSIAHAFSPDSKTLATVLVFDLSGAVRLWNVETGQAVPILSGQPVNVTSMAFSPDGKTLATGDRDGVVKLWEVAAGQ
jgi:WD40 repeat protein